MRIDRSSLALALATGFVLAGGASHAATWEGDTLNVQWLTPNPQTVAFNGNFIAPTSDIGISSGSVLQVSIGTDTVTFQNTADYGFGFSDSSIIKVSDLTASPIFNVLRNPNSTIFLTSGSLLSGSNFLQFDLQQATVPARSSLILDVGFTSTLGGPASVPEPASLALLGTGLAGVGLGLTRRRRHG